MYFLSLSNSDLTDRRIDLTIDLNCTSLEDARANAAKLKAQLNAPSARLFTYAKPEEYGTVEVVVVTPEGVITYRSALVPAMLQGLENHRLKGDIVMPFKYLLDRV